ncbi:MAG: hypothetical protein R2762_00965 [Bryobacteraceae bacterium]
MERLTMRISTVVISVGAETRFYRSLADVPANLRGKLTEATTGSEAMTLLIADEAGRREILRSVNGERSAVDSRLIRSLASPGGAASDPDGAPRRWPVRQWAEISLLAGIGVCLWLLARWG